MYKIMNNFNEQVTTTNIELQGNEQMNDEQGQALNNWVH